MTKRRVVITGLGAVSPFGVGVDKFWHSLVEGKSGITTSELIDVSKHVVKISGEVKNFNAEDYLDPKEAKKMDRFIQFAMIAADEAIKDAKLEEVNDVDPYKIGVIVSSAAGGWGPGWSAPRCGDCGSWSSAGSWTAPARPSPWAGWYRTRPAAGGRCCRPHGRCVPPPAGARQ